MSMSDDGGSLVVGLIMGIAIGAFFGCGLVNAEWEKQAIQNGCAYYEPKTAVFTWRAEVK